MILIVLLILVFAGLAIFGLFAFGVLGAVSRGQKRAESKAKPTLDAAFNGKPNVSFTINMQTLKFDDVVLGAKERGYRLAHQNINQYGAGTLLFEKV